jgi:hypothetical protein
MRLTEAASLADRRLNFSTNTESKFVILVNRPEIQLYTLNFYVVCFMQVVLNAVQTHVYSVY